jgi:PAS domain S-box-containing protein
LVKTENIVIKNKHGREISAVISAQITQDNNDEILLATIKNKETEHHNEHMLQMLSTSLNYIDDIVLLTDVNGKIVYVNKSFTEHYGYHITDIIDKRPGDVIGTGHHPATFYKDLFTNFLLKGIEWEGEIHNKTKSGQRVVDFVKIIPIMDEDCNPQFYLSIRKIKIDNSV